MATHKIAEITPEHVYVVVTKDDGSTFGKMIHTSMVDCSSLQSMRDTIRREAYKALTEPAPIALPITDLVPDINVDMPCVADAPPTKPDSNTMEKDMLAHLAGYDPKGYGKGFDIGTVLRAIIVNMASLRAGVLPSQLTQPQIQAEKARFVGIYKNV